MKIVVTHHPFDIPENPLKVSPSPLSPCHRDSRDMSGGLISRGTLPCSVCGVERAPIYGCASHSIDRAGRHQLLHSNSGRAQFLQSFPSLLSGHDGGTFSMGRAIWSVPLQDDFSFQAHYRWMADLRTMHTTYHAGNRLQRRATIAEIAEGDRLALTTGVFGLSRLNTRNRIRSRAFHGEYRSRVIEDRACGEFGAASLKRVVPRK